ncbi:MAG: hypothetical protein JNK87_30860 [Bryobacterales bacterium]|nr:hypothetical protein [Bryobacterales bacterium]
MSTTRTRKRLSRGKNSDTRTFKYPVQLHDLSTGKVILEGVLARSFKDAVKGVVNLHPDAPGPFHTWNSSIWACGLDVEQYNNPPTTDGVVLLQGNLRTPLYGVKMRERQTGVEHYVMVRVAKVCDWDSVIRSAYLLASRHGFEFPLDVLSVEGYQHSSRQFVAVRGRGPRVISDHVLSGVEVNLEMPLCKPAGYDGLKLATGCGEGGATA